MKNKCYFCGHSLVKIKSKPSVLNGEARLISEYACTNPECGAPAVYDKPYDE